MPRIPEGNFRTEASTRVESARPLQIESGGSKLRELGKVAGQVGKAMESAERRVESMKVARDGADEWENKEVPVLENIFGMSKSGFIEKGTKLPDGKVVNENTPLEKIISERVNAFNQRNIAGQTNPEAAEMYGKYVLGDTEKMVNKAKTYAKNEITKDTFNGLQTESQVLQQRLIDGAASTEDVAKYYSKVADNELIVGKDNATNLYKSFNQGLAIKADQIIASHPEGNTTQKQSEVKALVSNLPEQYRRDATRRIEKAIERRQISDLRKARVAKEKLANSTNTPMELGASAKQFSDVRQTQMNASLMEGETPKSRVSDFSMMEGKTLAIKVMGEVGHLEMSDPQFSKKVSDYLNESARDIASSGMMEYASEDEVKKAVVDKFNVEMYRLAKVRKDDPREFQKGFAPSLEMQVANNRPDSVVPQLIEQQQAFGISTDDTRFTSNQDIKSDAKLFKGWRDGQDPDGNSYLSYTDGIQSRWGASAGKALLESASKGGVDASTFYASEGTDSFRQQLGQGHGGFKKNLQKIADDKKVGSGLDRILKRGSVETRLMNQVKEEMKDSLDNIDGLYFGKYGDARYDGYAKSVAYIAANRAAKEPDLSVTDAISETIELMKEEFPQATDGNNMISVSKAYAEKFNIDTDNLSDMLSDAKEMKHLGEMGLELDTEKFTKFTAGNPLMAAKLEAVAGLSYDKEAQFDAFIESMGDNVRVSPDPNDSSRMKFYLQDPKTGAISQIPVKVDGTTEPLSVAIKDYYNEYNKKSIIGAKLGEGFGIIPKTKYGEAGEI